MSGKNRAFALAIATAALVGFCAPMASAATVQGPGSNTGFNGDSILDLAIAHFFTRDVSLLLGRGDGTFQPPVAYYGGGIQNHPHGVPPIALSFIPLEASAG